MSRNTVLRGENENPHAELIVKAGSKTMPKFRMSTRKMVYFLKNFTNEDYHCLNCDLNLAFSYIFSKAQSSTGSRKAYNKEHILKRKHLNCKKKVFCLDCATKLNYISKDDLPSWVYDFKYTFKGEGFVR